MHSSGNKDVGLGITKQGNSRVRKLLVEASQSYSRGNSGSFNKSKALKARQQGQSAEVISYADKASRRLTRRLYDLKNENKNHNVAVTAVARELACFIWGMATGHML